MESVVEKTKHPIEAEKKRLSLCSAYPRRSGSLCRMGSRDWMVDSGRVACGELPSLLSHLHKLSICSIYASYIPPTFSPQLSRDSTRITVITPRAIWALLFHESDLFKHIQSVNFSSDLCLAYSKLMLYMNLLEDSIKKFQFSSGKIVILEMATLAYASMIPSIFPPWGRNFWLLSS